MRSGHLTCNKTKEKHMSVKWKASLVTLALSLLMVTAAQAAESLRFVTSPTASGLWYVGAGAIGKAFMDKNPGYDVTLLPGGGTTNVPRVANGSAELGLSTHCISVAALKGLPPFKEAIPEGVSGVFNMWDRANFQIIALKDSGIKDLSELKTRKNVKIGVGASGSTTEILFRLILEAYGITYDDIKQNGGKILTNNFDDVANMARDGQIDVFGWFGPGEAWFVVEVGTGVDLNWINVGAEQAKKVGDTLGIKYGPLPADYYKGKVGEGVNVLWDNAAELIVASSLSEDTVYRLTKAVCESIDDIVLANAAWKTMDPAKGWEGLAHPLHPGAAKYYKEKGYMK